jgi:hypothetical protein
MTLERRNPLPKGVYWQDFFNPPVGGASIPNFQKWLRDNVNTVKLRASEFHGRGVDPMQAFVQGAWTLNPALALIANQLPGTGTERLWGLFEVLSPTPWPALAMGFPTVAPQGVATTEADTVQKPAPELEGFDLIGQKASELASVGGDLTGKLLLGAGAVLAVALLLSARK